MKLKIPAVKVNAGPLLKLGVDEDGNLQVPSIDQAKKPGWYSHSVTPGEIGVSVIISRFSTPRGPALLRNGSFLKVGDDIHVKRSDGATVTFSITEVEQRNGKSIDATSLDLESNGPELLLIVPGDTLTREVAHHKTDKGDKKARNETKSKDYYNVLFSADLTQRTAGK